MRRDAAICIVFGMTVAGAIALLDAVARAIMLP